MALKLACIWPDSHIPYHSVKAFALVMNVLSDLNPDEIVFLGDLADFYAVSSHGRHPGMMHLLTDEVAAVNHVLDTFDQCFPEARKVLVEGNHCYRLERYLINNAPALFGVTDLNYLFRFNQRIGWKLIPYGVGQSYSVLGSKLQARHEPLGSNAKMSVSKSMQSVCYGHIHRIEQAYAVSLSGEQYVNFSPGWLGDQRHKEIFGYIRGSFQWQLGFALVWVDTETGLFYHQIVPILESGNSMTCAVGGKLYKS